MRLSPISFVFSLLLLPSSHAHRIEIEPGTKECFFESLQPQDKASPLLSLGVYIYS